LRAIGLGAAAVVANELVPEPVPERRVWQVAATAPIGDRIRVVSTPPLTRALDWDGFTTPVNPNWPPIDFDEINRLTGLKAWLPTEHNASPCFGVDRSADSVFLRGLRYDGSEARFEDMAKRMRESFERELDNRIARDLFAYNAWASARAKIASEMVRPPMYIPNLLID
jgi:hypothetical protein